MRAVAMRLRVLRRYDWWGGGSPEERGVLDACLTAALLRRQERLGDEEDPRFLHPARTVLILMDDAEVQDARVLGAATLVESQEPVLAPEREELAVLPVAAVTLAAAVPVPAAARERLLEELIGADTAVQFIALAERLDHARHAHMLPGFERAPWLAETRDVYLPLAARLHPLLELRYQRWATALERRARTR